MSPDVVTTLGGSTVQHGPTSNRIYVMRLDPADLPGLLDDLDVLAEREGYTKIFAKVPASARDSFLERGYLEEARIPGLFRGREDGYLLSLFLDPARARASHSFDDVLAAARAATCRPVRSGVRCA